MPAATLAEVPSPEQVEAQIEKLFEGQPKGFPFDDFEVDDIMLPDGDDMDIPSDDDDAADEEEILAESGFGSVIVVDNLPAVPQEKYGKLTGLLRKLFSQIGTIREGGLYMPVDEATQVSKGFAFIEFSTPQEAMAARDQTNGYKLDRSHTFAVTLFDDFERYARVPEEYQEPEAKPYQPTPRFSQQGLPSPPDENLQEWMLDKRGRDQFVIRYRDQTEIYWNDAARSQAEEVYQRASWTESFVQWSPHGNYLATVHRQGVVVWGGASWQRLARFSHPGVWLLDFSPCEKYLVTYSSQEPSNPREKASVLFNVFETRTGKKLRSFTGGVDDYAVGTAAIGGGALSWPVFKWSERYVARLGKNAISVYEAPDMGLLDKKSIKLDAVQDFCWSPSAPVMAVYQVESAGGNLPARISLLRMPDRVELRQKNLFSVADVQMFWHPQGDYLAVQVDRYTKTKKSIYTGFELFSLNERDIPMEVLELPNKSEKIIDFAWEPKGTRFAILHGDGPKPSLTVYNMKDVKAAVKGVQPAGTLAGRTANSIHWSPHGRNLVLAGLKAMNGQLEFFNVDEFEIMNAGEHFMCTDIEWDPTGRYVATSVTSVHQMENGFNIWSWNGHLLYRLMKDRFFQFSWRPRNVSLLSAEQERDILKNLKKYSEKFAKDDDIILQQADTDLLGEREAMLRSFAEYLAERSDWAATRAAAKAKILADRYPGVVDDFTIEEVEMTETIQHTEEVWKG